MLPEIYSMLRASPAIMTLVDDRIYRHGEAPEGVVAPYVTWFVVTSVPENILDDRPPVDSVSIQIDCWSDNSGDGDAEVERVAEAVRDIMESDNYMSGIVVNGRDAETMRYRIGMRFTVWLHRNAVS